MMNTAKTAEQQYRDAIDRAYNLGFDGVEDALDVLEAHQKKLFAQFQATGQTYRLHDLIHKQDNEAARMFAEVNYEELTEAYVSDGKLLMTEVFGYLGGKNNEPRLFIDWDDHNKQATLVIANIEQTASRDDLHKLEWELFLWAQSEEMLDNL